MNHVSDNLTLYNGVKIPGLGFGVWQTDEEQSGRAGYCPYGIGTPG